MFGMYVDGVYDFVGFVVGVVECVNVLLNMNVCLGDVFIGVFFSGIYLNGFLLVCKVIEWLGVNLSVDCIFSVDFMFGEVLFVFIWIYVDIVWEVFVMKVVNVIVYIIGGGLIENILWVIF